MEDLIGKVINQIQKDLDWSETECLEMFSHCWIGSTHLEKKVSCDSSRKRIMEVGIQASRKVVVFAEDV